MRYCPALAAFCFAIACVGSSQADVIVSYNFDDEDNFRSPTTEALHLTAAEISGRTTELIYQASMPSHFDKFSDGVVKTDGWTSDPDTTNALTFTLTMDEGWQATLDWWSVTVLQVNAGEKFQMRVDVVSPAGPFVEDWGWFRVEDTRDMRSDSEMNKENYPHMIQLQGGQTYRFSLFALGGSLAYFDNLSIEGTIQSAPHLPEPGALGVLAMGVMMVGVRGCRAQWSARPVA